MPIGVACLASLLLVSTPSVASVDIEAMWNFGDPAASERRFDDALRQAHGEDALILHTQIARTYSLRGRFSDAHGELDRVEHEAGVPSAEVGVRLLLERGRTWRSSDDAARAEPMFRAAWERARAAGLDFLAADAAHMVALVVSDPVEQISWNQKAIDFATNSVQAKAKRWLASLHNNLAWTLHGLGRYEEALEHFQIALSERERRGEAGETRVAQWAVARCLRSMARYDEALAIQLRLQSESETAGDPDGYIYEEIGELKLVQGDPAAARPYFAKAYARLQADPDLRAHEPERLERIRGLSQ